MAIYPKRVNYILIECMMLLRKLRSSIRILVNSFRFYPFSQQWDGKCKGGVDFNPGWVFIDGN